MKTKKVAFLGMAISLAMILSYVESLVPPLVALPGVKVGLPNLVIMFLLYRLGWKDAVAVSVIRVVLVALLFGNVQSLLFSVSGAVFSLVGMILLKKSGLFSTITVSIVGGILHNVGQIIMACLWTSTAQIAYYLPVLMISGVIAGTVIGLAAGMLIKKLENIRI